MRVGGADHAGEQRGLADREVGELFAEVELRRLGDAEDALGTALSEVDLVQVVLEDLLSSSSARSATIAIASSRTLRRVRALLAQEEVLHELLRERAAALDDPTGRDVVRDARAMPRRSIAPCSKKRLSSAASTACTMRAWDLIKRDDVPLLPHLVVEPGERLGLERRVGHLLAGHEIGDTADDAVLEARAESRDRSSGWSG